MSAPARRHQTGLRQTLAQALVAIAAAGASYASAMGLGPPAVARQLATPEAMLVRALLDIGESRFSSALERIDNLPASNPNFPLARYQIETPRVLAPRYLLQMPQKQKYALVLDSAKSTLFVFENTGGATGKAATPKPTCGITPAATSPTG